MKIKFLIFLSSLVFITISSCNEKEKNTNGVVTIKNMNDLYLLYRHGKPYYIKGAGAYVNLEKIKEYGGNSVRIWNTEDAKRILDEAHKLGLTVTLGLEVGKERLGFDYNNEEQVKTQFENLKKEVIKYKDHPALLLWAIGNEVDQLGSNKKVWDAVNDIAKMIHEIDPNHPTTTVVIPHRKTILYVKLKCPEIDILSFNTFDELSSLSPKLNEWIWGWDGPYIITEWGSSGWWESEKTAWDASIELTSTEKAWLVKKYYQVIQDDKYKCLGSYVFYWGAKQEKTHTWFSMFTKEGHETESVQTMYMNWTGATPKNFTPWINYIVLNEKKSIDNIFLNSNSANYAYVSAADYEKDTLSYSWELLPESIEYHLSDKEKKPDAIKNLIKDPKQLYINFKAPEKEGAYRLFVYIYDNHNHVATANIPFYVLP